MALSRLLDALVSLRLRLPARRLVQRTHDAAPRQLDLEVVVAEAARLAQYDLRGAQEALPRCRSSPQLRFGFAVAPGLVRHAAQHEARLLDGSRFDLEPDRHRNERERIGQPVANLQIRVVAGKTFRRQLDRCDDLVWPQVAVDMGRTV